MITKIYNGPYVVKEERTTVYRVVNCDKPDAKGKVHLNYIDANEYKDAANLWNRYTQMRDITTPELQEKCLHSDRREKGNNFDFEYYLFICPDCGRYWMESSARWFMWNNRENFTDECIIANPDPWVKC